MVLINLAFGVTIYNGELNTSINGVVNNIVHVYGLVCYSANKREQELNVPPCLNIDIYRISSVQD